MAAEKIQDLVTHIVRVYSSATIPGTSGHHFEFAAYSLPEATFLAETLMYKGAIYKLQIYDLKTQEKVLEFK